MILEAALVLTLMRSPKPPCVDVHGVKKIIACAAKRYQVPGGAERALAIAECESSFDPRAKTGTHVGLYQHRLSLWPARWRKYAKPLGLPRDPYNPLTNAVVTMRMATDLDIGWTPWSCAA